MVGDAENLPFDEDSFDLYTIAFGIRNVTHIDRVSCNICLVACVFDSFLYYCIIHAEEN